MFLWDPADKMGSKKRRCFEINPQKNLYSFIYLSELFAMNYLLDYYFDNKSAQ